MDERKPLVKAGALWKRESRTGGYVYLSGEILVNGETIRILVFPTKPEWKKPNSPDFEIKVELGTAGAVQKPREARQPKVQPVELPPLKTEGLGEFGL